MHILKLETQDIKQFKADMQEAFQQGFIAEFGETDLIILPEKDINECLNSEGVFAYKAVENGEILGGAVISINEKTNHNHLDFLYVKYGCQSKGIGKRIWFEIERLYPQTRVWETCTPYFEKRNIHFYVNVCGFQVNEFFNEKHIMPDEPQDFVGDGNEGMFGFVKVMKSVTIEEIMQKMIIYSDGNTHDINHLMKVHSYAHTIGILEKIDAQTQFILETAAILHDIACPLCREKYGNTNGKYQEKESIILASEFLKDMGLTQVQKDRVCYLVGHHHTLDDIQGLDYQILIEADYLVNADESKYSVENIKNFEKMYFKTKTGKDILKSIYLR